SYRDFWRGHPAFAPAEFTADITDFVDYDLAPPEKGPDGQTVYRSRVSEAAVRADGRDLLDGDASRKVLGSLADPAVLLWAARGRIEAGVSDGPQAGRAQPVPQQLGHDRPQGLRILQDPGVGRTVDQHQLPARPAGGVAGGGHRHHLIPLAMENEDRHLLLLQ